MATDNPQQKTERESGGGEERERTHRGSMKRWTTSFCCVGCN